MAKKRKNDDNEKPRDGDDSEAPQGGTEGPGIDPERREFIAELKKEILGDLLTTAEVAEILDVHPRTVGEYIRDGRLLATQIGGSWRISVEHLKRFIQGESLREPRGSLPADLEEFAQVIRERGKAVLKEGVERAFPEVVELGGKSRRRRGRPSSMFERFTDQARRVIVLAQAEARQLHHNYIGTEHLLLGLLGDEGVAAQALERLEVDFDTVRSKVAEMVGEGTHASTGHLPFTPRSKKVLEMSLREGLQMGHNYVGTEHILLGLIREGEGIAAQVLVDMDLPLGEVRAEVMKILGEGGAEPRRKKAE